MAVASFQKLTRSQRRAYTAAFLGWTLDAFDFFILTYCLDAVAVTFGVSREAMTLSLFWTLAMRPLGALLFGLLAERIGRRPTLMINVVCFSVLELMSAFAPSYRVFLIMRALFGVAMGGEWGVGAALALESLPAEGRGFFSGLLQEGYVVGNLLAAAVYGVWALLTAHLPAHGIVGSWRILFVVGALPSLLVFFVRRNVEESPAWLARRRGEVVRAKVKFADQLALLRGYLPNFLFLTLLMFAFNSLSHGSQDLYPTFLKHDKGLTKEMTSVVAIVANVGAFAGGLLCGTLSERLGRRRVIVLAAVFTVLMVPLWAFSHGAVLLAAGGFLLQFCLQGAWGVVPVHLNELAPGPVRAIVPGLAYQLGNLLSSGNIYLQSLAAKRYFDGRLGPVMAWDGAGCGGSCRAGGVTGTRATWCGADVSGCAPLS